MTKPPKREPVRVFDIATSEYNSSLYLDGDADIHKCVVPNSELHNTLITTGAGLKHIDCQNLYKLVELRAKGCNDHPDHILKNWNNSGFSFKASLNLVHITILAKETVELKEALEKLIKALEGTFVKTSTTSSTNKNSSYDRTILAHHNKVESVTVSRPEYPLCTNADDFFPDAILINEINNDHHLSYVILKAFYEQYIKKIFIGLEPWDHKLPKVRLSYVLKEEFINTFKLEGVGLSHFDTTLIEQLILLVRSKTSNTGKILKKLRKPDYFDVFKKRNTSSIIINTGRKNEYSQPVITNEIVIVKKPDVMLFSEAFLEELPSYIETTTSKIPFSIKMKRYRYKLKKVLSKSFVTEMMG